MKIRMHHPRFDALYKKVTERSTAIDVDGVPYHPCCPRPMVTDHTDDCLMPLLSEAVTMMSEMIRATETALTMISNSNNRLWSAAANEWDDDDIWDDEIEDELFEDDEDDEYDEEE